MPHLLRAAIYARYSTDLQSDASVEDQIRSCQDLAKSLGAEVVATYSDHAVSGASLMRRGIQSLLRDNQSGSFNVVLAEGLDRLSRNQADVAQIYQQMSFTDTVIHTQSEGEISELHIGLKGTMNALQLKDIALKTHRGLKGRALKGKSAGGISYGYRVKQQFDASGEPIRGDREIQPVEAQIVTRIFEDYANGLSPKKIAEALNAEGIAPPSSRYWGASTIHGNRQRGTGILNNELYIGRQIWNRLNYRKDPSTGKRISRLNPESAWVITEVPALRIIEQELWDRVRTRQGALTLQSPLDKPWDRRRPRTLFSGLMTCGCCGGGIAKVSKSSFGCSSARNKGKAVCANMRTIAQTDLEARVLNALTNHLMDPEALAVFCETYADERNRLRREADGARETLERGLAQTKRDHQKLVDAIIAGVPAEQVKERMIELDQQRQQLERRLSASPAPDPILIHPSMAVTYRERVAALIAGLGRSAEMPAAKEALRALVDRIVLIPAAGSTGVEIELEGDLASLLRLATGLEAVTGTPKAALCGETRLQGIDIIGELVLVAGVGFEPTTFRL